MEKYVLCKLDNKYKKAIVQFRVSSHKLSIKTGRHEKPIIPLSCRICKYCHQDSIDNEQHFLVDCHFHDDNRYTLLGVMSNYINGLDGKNSREKYIPIMKCKEIPALNALESIFITVFKNENPVKLALYHLMWQRVFCACVCVWVRVYVWIVHYSVLQTRSII